MKKSRFTESQIVGILKEAPTARVQANEIWRETYPPRSRTGNPATGVEWQHREIRIPDRQRRWSRTGHTFRIGVCRNLHFIRHSGKSETEVENAGAQTA